MNFANVKSMTIPVGGVARDVKAVSIGGVEVWRKLPYDAEVEYIEVTGGTPEIVIPSVPCDGYMSFLLRVESVVNSSGNYPYTIQIDGTAGTKYSYRAILYGQKSTNKIYFENGMGSLVIDSGSVPSDIAYTKLRYHTNPATAKTLYLCGGLCAKSYAFTLYDLSENVIHDFTPVRVGSGANAVGCLYDKLGVGGMNPDGSARDDGLYFNRGSGAFVVGPDKSTASLLSSPSPALQLQTPEADPDATADEPQEEQTD